MAVATKDQKAPTPRLLEKYNGEILPGLGKKFGRENKLSLPKLQKIVLNMAWARRSRTRNG